MGAIEGGVGRERTAQGHNPGPRPERWAGGKGGKQHGAAAPRQPPNWAGPCPGLVADLPSAANFAKNGVRHACKCLFFGEGT